MMLFAISPISFIIFAAAIFDDDAAADTPLPRELYLRLFTFTRFFFFADDATFAELSSPRRRLLPMRHDCAAFAMI